MKFSKDMQLRYACVSKVAENNLPLKHAGDLGAESSHRSNPDRVLRLNYSIERSPITAPTAG